MDRRNRSHFHWPLLGAILALVVIGLFNLHSATFNLKTGGFSPLLWNQAVSVLVGSAIGVLLLFVDYRVLIRLAYSFHGISLILLILVVFFGKTVQGNRSWLALGPITFQPSELAKLSLAIVLARYLSDHPASGRGYSLWELVRPGLLAVIPLLLIILGKDLGSAFFFLLFSSSLFLFAGVERRVVVSFLALFLIAAPVSYRFLLSPHQKARVEAFINPGKDPKGIGYHIIQSNITVGSGRVFGKGYLKGMHSKLLYLPERHTDFIFPVLAEEWGFVGSVGVLALYLFVLLFGIGIASRARERFGVFLALGVTGIFFWQIAINLGGVLGLIPLTGVTLPLLSYGGSSLVTTLIGLSLLFNVEMRRFMF